MFRRVVRNVLRTCALWRSMPYGSALVLFFSLFTCLLVVHTRTLSIDTFWYPLCCIAANLGTRARGFHLYLATATLRYILSREQVSFFAVLVLYSTASGTSPRVRLTRGDYSMYRPVSCTVPTIDEVRNQRRPQSLVTADALSACSGMRSPLIFRYHCCVIELCRPCG